jgi:methylphosphotriester-DNA--protein-cysteine methyltransferase
MKGLMKIGFVTSVFLFAYIYAKAVQAKYRYAVAPNSNKYHYPSCRWVKKSGSANLETFDSVKDSLAAGYVPCKVCKPPVKD